MFRFINAIPLAIKCVLLHKLRSLLTMLGIVFGVFSVIAMMAIGEGASQQAQNQVLELGATNIIVLSVKPPQETSASQQAQGGFVLRYGLKRDDFNLLSGTLHTVTNAIPIREVAVEARYLHRAMNVRLVGGTSEYRDVNHLKLSRGRFISDQDQRDYAKVVVLAKETADTLFPFEDPIDKAVRVGGTYYTVVGVTEERTASAAIGGSLAGQDYNKDIYVPIETLRVRLGDLIFERQQGSFSAEQIELNQITLQVAHRDDVLPTAEAVRESLTLNHDKKDYAVIVPMELLKQADQIRYIFNVVLGSVAAISLVVGGIGIMNIMLATVTERTREIGVRRALGAKRRDIVEQFLIETVVLSGSGGIVGVVMGWWTPGFFGAVQGLLQESASQGAQAGSELGRIFSELVPLVPFWSMPVAFGISVGIGIIFGLYPAWSAARLDPIEALRHE